MAEAAATKTGVDEASLEVVVRVDAAAWAAHREVSVGGGVPAVGPGEQVEAAAAAMGLVGGAGSAVPAVAESVAGNRRSRYPGRRSKTRRPRPRHRTHHPSSPSDTVVRRWS